MSGWRRAAWTALGLFAAALPLGAVEFVQVTDLHVADQASHDAARALLERIDAAEPRPDFIVVTGDNVNAGSKPKEVELFLKSVSGLRTPVHIVLGNHDLSGDGVASKRMSEKPYYSFDEGGVHFAVLDVFGRQPDQPAWLEKDLAAAAAAGRDTVLFSHDSLGREHGESVRLREAASRGPGRILGVFAGHWHSLRGFTDGNLPTFLTPPLSMGGIESSPMGYRRVRVDGGALSQEFVPAGFERRAGVSSYIEAAGSSVHVLARFFDSELEAAAAVLSGGGVNLPLSRLDRWAFEVRVPQRIVPSSGTLRFFSSREVVLAEVPFQGPGAAAALPRLGGDWSTFHRDGRRTGATADDPGPFLRPVWAAHTGGTAYSASPVYHRGRVYAAASDWDSGTKAALLALDAVNGRRLWERELPGSVMHAPSVTDLLLSAMTVNGELCLLDPADGRLLSVHRASAPVYQLHSPGATALDSLGRHIGGTHAHLSAVDGDGRYVADYSSGTVDDWVGTLMSPASDGDVTFAGSLWRTGLWEIDHARGIALRTWGILEGYGASPVLGPDMAFYIGDGKLRALDRGTGKEVWARDGFGRGVATPALDASDGGLYAVDSSARLVRLDSRSGAEVWKQEAAVPSAFGAVPYRRGGRQVLSSPAVSKRYVWVVDLEGNISAVEKSGGRVASRYALGAPTISSPAISGNTLFIAAMDGFLYALTGSETP